MWQKSMELVVEVYALTEKFPKSELYGLVMQMRRCSVSIPSNIAEGRRRGSKKDLRQFFIVAFGSGAELETQVEIARRLPFGKDMDYIRVDLLLDQVMRILNTIIQKLQATS